MPIRNDNSGDYVTGAEFTRWTTEQADFRARLEARSRADHTELVGALRRIEDGVKATNGSVATAKSDITLIKNRLDIIEEDDANIEKIVQKIRDDGCSQYAAHVDIIQSGVVSWSPKKKAIAASGLVGLGVLVWPAVQELIALIHAVVDKLPVK